MKLTSHEHKYFIEKLKPYMEHDTALTMRNYIQHGKTSTYEHCHDVARLSFLLNRRLGLKANEDILLPAAFLHDLYLYDWHIPGPGNRWHGYTHADIARRNAKKHFDVCGKVDDIIRTHMWPLNLTRVPKSKEAWIVCMADKIISTRETLNRK